jgi:3'(2'), 5'-bisphosphate nucleotidase
MKQLLEDVKFIAKQAGDKIMEIYQDEDFEVQLKTDNSPLTKADLAAHNIIVNFLETRYPSIPCLSEESAHIEFNERRKWTQCFIIDPLDGTKEFIDRNGEFTVNIALQKDGKPILGVIYVPTTGILYYAAEGDGAYKQQSGYPSERIKVRKIKKDDELEPIKVMTSRRNQLESVRDMCQSLGNCQFMSFGSSLKMCMIAEGNADIYPKLAPTSEWDTAAAQVILEQAGGRLVALNFERFLYNQKESLINPSFLAIGDSSFDWKKSMIIPRS